MGEASRYSTLQSKYIMISIQYFAIIYIVFENLALGLKGIVNCQNSQYMGSPEYNNDRG